MAFETKSRYFSGQGVMMLGDADPTTGEPLGLLPVGNVSSLKVAVATSIVEHKDAQSGQRGIDLRLTTEIKATVEANLESWSADNLAVALRGTVTKVASGSATAEPGTVYLGMVMPLKHVSTTAVVVTKSAATLTPWAAGTADTSGNWDYKVNEAAGSIQWAAVPKATIVDGDPVTIAYTFAAQQDVDTFTTPAPEKYLRFEGLNTAEQFKPVVVEIFRFNTDPLKELDLISDTVAPFALAGNALMDARRTSGSKYFRVMMAD